MNHVNAWSPRRQKRALNPLQMELQVICEPSCGCWEENLGPLDKPQLFTAEPLLRPQKMLML